MLPDIQRRVVNAKYILERAAKMQAESNEMSLSISLLLMHDASELLMLAVLDHLRVTPKKRREFMDFWPDIKQAGHPEPPDFVAMESLNKLRVGLKHNGNLPHPQMVRDLLARAKGFFENVLKVYCGLSYSDVSLIDLVPDQDVRALLQAAQKKFSLGSKGEAVTDLAFALRKVEYPKGQRLPLLQAPDKPRLSSDTARAGWGTYLDQLHSFLNQTAFRTNAIMLGIDPLRYAFFARNTPQVSWSLSGQSQVILSSSYEEVSEENFADMVEFLIDYAMKVGEVYIPKAVGAR